MIVLFNEYSTVIYNFHRHLTTSLYNLDHEVEWPCFPHGNKPVPFSLSMFLRSRLDVAYLGN